MNNDLISREALKKAIKDKYSYASATAFLLTMRDILPQDVVYQILAIIDNAPTVCGNNPKWCESCVSKGKCASTREQGECKKCDYYSFSQAFINGIVELISKNGLTTVDELLEILKKGANDNE